MFHMHKFYRCKFHIHIPCERQMTPKGCVRQGHLGLSWAHLNAPNTHASSSLVHSQTFLLPMFQAKAFFWNSRFSFLFFAIIYVFQAKGFFWNSLPLLIFTHNSCRSMSIISNLSPSLFFLYHLDGCNLFLISNHIYLTWPALLPKLETFASNPMIPFPFFPMRIYTNLTKSMWKKPVAQLMLPIKSKRTQSF